MEKSIGSPGPTTDGEPDAITAETDARHIARDVPPPVGYEGTVLSDPDAGARSVDPLDRHAPSRETSDPLDPDGHVI